VTVTPQSFAESLLNALGAPLTQPNIQAIVAWEAREGGNWHNNARNNPLNTTMRVSGSTGINSVGVQSYPSWSAGLQATVKTLQLPAYAGIVTALRAGHGLTGNIPALGTWSGGGYTSIDPSTGLGYGGGQGTIIGGSSAPASSTSTSSSGPSGFERVLLDAVLVGAGAFFVFRGTKRTLSTAGSGGL
jgi:hypothetical protein